VKRDKVQGANRSKNAREDCASASVQICEKKEKGKVKGKEGKPLEAKVVGVVGHARACLLAGGGTYISFRGAEAQKLGAMEEFDDSILKTK
jgi:hypothetical protein